MNSFASTFNEAFWKWFSSHEITDLEAVIEYGYSKLTRTFHARAGDMVGELAERALDAAFLEFSDPVKPRPENPWAWICRNLLWKLGEHHKKQNRLYKKSIQYQMLVHVQASGSDNELLEILGNLPRRKVVSILKNYLKNRSDTHRKIFWRHFLKDKTANELAVEFGRAPETISGILWKMKNELREASDKISEDGRIELKVK